MKKIHIELDGNPMAVEPGTTILEAATRSGISIPTFCHVRELKPEAHCYICVVEVDGMEELAPSCSTPVAPGMVISTDSHRVLEARRTCVELLLSTHVGDCLGPCMTACPAGIDIPGFVNHLAAGNVKAAHELILRDMPLPGVLGRICKRPCEVACRRQLVDEAVAICHLKRFAADMDVQSSNPYVPCPAKATGKRIAIVGAGPAGLSAAYFLQIFGHSCTIFDANDAAGGMLRYGIPEFRLPGTVIDTEVNTIQKLGASFIFGQRLGRELSITGLQQSFDAVFVALGAQTPLTLGLPGEDALGVYSGLEFLKRYNRRGSDEPIGAEAVVIGGGDVAIDATRVALRAGASAVHLYCLEQESEMPASSHEVASARAEGIEIHPGHGVAQIRTDGKKVTGLDLNRCTAVFDGQGNFAPAYDDREITQVSCDTLIVAIGQGVDLAGAKSIRADSRQILAADSRTAWTGLAGVFAGGDCVTGPGGAVEAVAEGKKAAVAIDQYVRGEAMVGELPTYSQTFGDLEDIPAHVYEGYAKAPRSPMPELDPSQRVQNRDEVETGFSADDAQKEAQRCMECGCRAAAYCRLRAYSTLTGAQEGAYPGKHPEYHLDNSHPDIIYQAHKCILCRTCVRITKEILGTEAMRVVGRGFAARVEPYPDGKLALADNKGLTQIVEHCPVGALTLRTAPVQTLDPVRTKPD